MANLIHPWLKGAFHTVGIDVRRHRPSNEAPRKHDPETSGTRVEFIGPSCVGKTTTLDRLPETVKQRWLYRPDLEKLATPPVREPSVSRTHEQLLFRELRAIYDYPMGTVGKTKYITYLTHLIANDLKLLHSHLAAGVLLDEGVFQVFKSGLLNLPDKRFAEIMRPRGLVFLTASDPTTVLNQIDKRTRETAKTRAIYASEDKRALKRMIEANTQSAHQLACKAEYFGAPVLRLYAEDGATRNANRLVDFLNDLTDLRQRNC